MVRVIKSLLKNSNKEVFFFDDDEELNYRSSRTQWAAEDEVIEFTLNMSVSKSSDPGLHSFVKKIAELDNLEDVFKISTQLKIDPKDEHEIQIFVNGEELQKYATGEVYRRLSSSNVVAIHDSAGAQRRIFSPKGMASYHEMMLSKTEKDELKKEQERIKKKVRKFAQEHRSELSEMLGKLEEKYEVELTMFDGVLRDTIPLGINLRDKGVDVPLDDWGAGTQNRTRIMMSILSASKIKNQADDENRITPIIIIEEPESFLHPSAQAEFGRVIRSLARELQVQILITTHSPYMLCQEHPESNILLNRKVSRGKLKESNVVPVTAEKWMEPFGEILGLQDESVEPWSHVVKAKKDNAILVEGDIDKEYIEHIASLGLKGFELPDDVEILPYGGKDALKNSIMLKFVIQKFDKVFITFDLDAKSELSRVMGQLGLVEEVSFMALGAEGDGKDCIEGLVSQKVHSAVYGANADLILALGSCDGARRKSAKNQLKRKILDEFKSQNDLDSSTLKGFRPLFSSISRAFKAG